MMVKMTPSLRRWMYENGYAKEIVLLEFGHVECFTAEMEKAYIEWLQTNEKGGTKNESNA